jgi:hypothetical protein
MKGGALAMPVATTTEPVIVNSGLNGFTAFFVALRFTVRTPLTLTVEAVSRAMAAERLPVRVREERDLPQLPYSCGREGGGEGGRRRGWKKSGGRETGRVSNGVKEKSEGR